MTPWTSAGRPEHNLCMKKPTSKLFGTGAKIFSFLLMLALSGCSRQTELAPVTVRELAAGDHCLGTGAAVVSDMNELRAALGGDPGPVQVDFTKERVVTVSAGQRPTAGYRLQLVSSQVQVAGGKVLIRLQEQKPSGDSMVAQVLTTPCIVLALTRGTYAAVEFVDDRERSLATIELKENPSP
jgi:hypothetical protein